MSLLSPVTPADLNSAMDALKRRNTGQRAISNYFHQPLGKVAGLRKIESEKSVCFLHDEWDFGRLFFHTFDVDDLEGLLNQVTFPAITVTDWISKTETNPVQGMLANLGFHLHAIFDRIVCKSIRNERCNPHLCMATAQDCEAIHALLFRVFDKYSDHILPMDELADLIAKEQVIITRGPAGAIDGLVAFPINGQSCNYNFLYNSAGPLNLARLLGNFYGTLTERGVRSGFSWVRRTRPLVLKLHQSFGWTTDGLMDFIYVR